MRTQEQRQKDVEQTNANLAIDGTMPDAMDKKLQAGYLDGTVSTDDMLKHAREIAARAQRERK